MSHLVKIELEINDITALKRTCARLGLQFMADQKTFKWYGREPAPCEAAIKVPGQGYGYEIGVVKEGKGYSLQTDFFDLNIIEKIGQKGGLLKQGYAIEKAKWEAIKKGYSVREHKTPTGVQLRIQVGG